MLHALREFAIQQKLIVTPGLKPKFVRWLLVFSPSGEFLEHSGLDGRRQEKTTVQATYCWVRSACAMKMAVAFYIRNSRFRPKRNDPLPVDQVVDQFLHHGGTVAVAVAVGIAIAVAIAVGMAVGAIGGLGRGGVCRGLRPGRGHDELRRTDFAANPPPVQARGSWKRFPQSGHSVSRVASTETAMESDRPSAARPGHTASTPPQPRQRMRRPSRPGFSAKERRHVGNTRRRGVDVFPELAVFAIALRTLPTDQRGTTFRDQVCIRLS